MQKIKINVAYFLSVASVTAYTVFPNFFQFKKAVDFVIAGAVFAMAVAGLVLFVFACRKLNYDKEQLPLFSASILTLGSIAAICAVKFIYSFSLGFVPVSAPDGGLFRYLSYIGTAYSMFNLLAMICFNHMKTEE